MHAPLMQSGERLKKTIHFEDGDRIQSVIDEYPFYKTEYHTMRFADVARLLLDIVEDKVVLEPNKKLAISYR